MRGTGETGPAPEGYATRSDYSQPPGPQSQTDSEKAESQRQAALRHAPLHGLPTNNTDPVKFRRYPVLNADDNIETKKAPPAEVQLGGNPATPNFSTKQKRPRKRTISQTLTTIRPKLLRAQNVTPARKQQRRKSR